MFKYEIWNGLTPINGVDSKKILEEREDLKSNLGDIFLVIESEYDRVVEICISSNIKFSYRLNKEYTIDQVAKAYVDYVNASGTLAPNIEEQANKISILEQENATLKQDLELTQNAVNELIFNSISL